MFGGFNPKLKSLKSGWGADMQMRTETAATHNALKPGLVKFTGSSVTVNGIRAQTVSTIWLLYNATAGNLSIGHQNTGAAVIDRIITPNGGTLVIPANFYAMGFYDSVTQRNRIIDVNSLLSVSTPLILTAGNLTIQVANISQSGYLTATDWNTFNSKPSGAGLLGSAAFWSSTSFLTADALFSYNDIANQLGIGVDYTTSEATVHAESDTAQTVADATALTASLVGWTNPTPPSSFTIGIATPDLQSPIPSATPNYGSSGYIADGSSTNIDYIVRPGYDDGSNPIVWGVSTNSALSTDDGSTNVYGVDIVLTPPAQNFTPNVWSFSRQINGGGFNDYQRFTSASFTDTNSGWTAGSDTFTVFADDFHSTGVTYNVNVYGLATSPIATTIVSPSPAFFSYPDGNTNAAFKLDFAQSGGTSPYRFDVNGTATWDTGSTAFTASPSTFTAGSVVTSPSSYGYLSDGSILTNSYDFYASSVLSGVTVYAANPFNAPTTDPNDGNYYYITLSSYSPFDGKILKNGSSGINVTGATILDDGVTVFGDGTGVTPSSYYAPTGIFAAHGSSITDPATVILRSLDGTYSRLEFQDSTKTRVGYIEQTASYLRLTGGDLTSQIHISNSNIESYATYIGNTAATITHEASSVGTLTSGNSMRFGWSPGGAAIYIPSGATAGIVYNGSYFIQVDSAGVTFNSAVNFSNTINAVFGTSTGSKLGTSTSQKLAFWNATPIVQPGATVEIGTVLSNIGLRAAGTAYPITTSGAVAFTGVTNNVGTITTGVWAGTTIAVAKGGTGSTLASLAAEDVILGSSSTALKRLAVGSNGDVLTVTAGVVGWAAGGGSLPNPITDGTGGIGGVDSVDWQNRLLVDSTANNSIDWENKYLLDFSGVQKVLWDNSSLQDSSGNQAMDWTNRMLVDVTGGSTAAQWGQSTYYFRLTGADAVISSLRIDPSFGAVDVAAPTDGDVWYNGTNLYFRNGVVNVDLLAGGGSLPNPITDGAGGIGGTDSVDWQNRLLVDSTGVDAVNYSNRTLIDDTATVSIDWNNHALRDYAGIICMDYGAREFSDAVGPNRVAKWGQTTYHFQFDINTTAKSQIRLLPSSTVNVTSPVNGDIWYNGTQVYFYNGTDNIDLLDRGYVAKTANYVVVGSDRTVNCTANSFNVTLLTAVGRAGKRYTIKNSGTGVITLLTTSSQTVDGAASGSYTMTQYQSYTVESDGANWIII